MLWDGSFLFKINRKDITNIVKITSPYSLGTIVKNETRLNCTYFKSNTLSPIIFDKLALTVFGYSLGTHYVTIGTSTYILYNVNNVVKLSTLSYNDCSEEFIRRVQNILVFRLLFGLPVNNTSIIVIDNLPFSFENRIEKRNNIINDSFYRWIGEKSVGDIINRIFARIPLNDFQQLIHNLCIKIDGDLIWLSSVFCNNYIEHIN